MPEQPAAGVGDRAFLFQAVGRRQQEHLGLDLLRVDAGAMPVVRGLGVMQLRSDEPIEIVHRLSELVRIGHGVHRVQADDDAAAYLVPVHAVEEVEVGIVPALLDLRQQFVAEAVFLGGVVAVPGLQQRGEVLGLVLPPVGRLRVLGDRRVALDVFVVGLPAVVRHGHVAGDDMVQQGVVGGTLDVGLAAQGVDAAASHADVAQQELDDAGGADVLHAHGVLGPAQCVHDGPGLVAAARGRKGLVDLQQVLFGNAGGGRNGLDVVPAVVLLHQLEDAPGILQRLVALGHPVGIELESPLGLVVSPGLLVVTREYAVLEAEVLAHDECGVGVFNDVFLEVFLVVENVLDHAAQESDVRAGPQGDMKIRASRSTRELRVHMHDSGARVLGLQNPLE